MSDPTMRMNSQLMGGSSRQQRLHEIRIGMADGTDTVRALVECGFDLDTARTGAIRMESGQYAGFGDLALSLLEDRPGDGALVQRPGLTAPIAEVRQRIRVIAPRFARTDEPSALEFLGAAIAVEHPQPGSGAWRGSAPVARSRTILESAVATAVGDGLFDAVLITEGTGSSGIYPASTLADAASRNVFHAGLHCYLDHPTSTDAVQRPERSVRDLAGVLETDATYRDGGLFAKVRVFAPFAEFIGDRASSIGMSIRAEAEVDENAGGFMAAKPTISRITRAHSVDFVTRAGRGGRILQSAGAPQVQKGATEALAQIDAMMGIEVRS